MVQLDTVTLPEVIQVFLAYPLLSRFSVVLVFSLQEHTLVVLDILLQLVVTSHRAAKQAILRS